MIASSWIFVQWYLCWN